MADNQSDLDAVIYQLRDIQYDLETYDPDYDGYSPLERVLQKLHVAVQLLDDLKRRYN